MLHFRHACIDLLQEFQKLCYLGIDLTEGVCGTANGLVLIRYNTFGLSGNLRSFVSGNLNLFDDPGDLTGGVQGLIRQLPERPLRSLFRIRRLWQLQWKR